MPVKKTGITKLQARMQQKNDTEFSRELSKKAQKGFEKISGVDDETTERIGNYGVFPGE